MPDINPLAIVVDHRDQPVLVPADVEHHELVNLIDLLAEHRANVIETVPFGMFGGLMPRSQWALGISMDLPKFAAASLKLCA